MLSQILVLSEKRIFFLSTPNRGVTMLISYMKHAQACSLFNSTLANVCSIALYVLSVGPDMLG